VSVEPMVVECRLCGLIVTLFQFWRYHWSEHADALPQLLATQIATDRDP